MYTIRFNIDKKNFSTRSRGRQSLRTDTDIRWVGVGPEGPTPAIFVRSESDALVDTLSSLINILGFY